MFRGGLLRQRAIPRGDATEPELIAQLEHTLMLDAHPRSAVISSSRDLLKTSKRGPRRVRARRLFLASCLDVGREPQKTNHGREGRSLEHQSAEDNNECDQDKFRSIWYGRTICESPLTR